MKVDRALGGFLGLAIGDALGAQVEFKRRGTFPDVKEMTGGGPFGLRPGQTTDDTEMAILMAQSLIEKRGIDPVDLMSRWLYWYHSPECFDIGNTIREALDRFQYEGQPFQGLNQEDKSGNGSIMRLYPAILWGLELSEEKAFEIAWDVSRLTHGSDLVRKTTRDFYVLIRKLLNGISKEEALKGIEINDHPQSTGFVVDTYECALWGFSQSSSFEDGLLKVVNLGGDSDTAGAVYGQIAGSHYGKEGLPNRFLKKLEGVSLIEDLTMKLLKRGNV